jgi:hypothetical protein
MTLGRLPLRPQYYGDGFAVGLGDADFEDAITG